MTEGGKTVGLDMAPTNVFFFFSFVLAPFFGQKKNFDRKGDKCAQRPTTRRSLSKDGRISTTDDSRVAGTTEKFSLCLSHLLFAGSWIRRNLETVVGWTHHRFCFPSLRCSSSRVPPTKCTTSGRHFSTVSAGWETYITLLRCSSAPHAIYQIIIWRQPQILLVSFPSNARLFKKHENIESKQDKRKRGTRRRDCICQWTRSLDGNVTWQLEDDDEAKGRRGGSVMRRLGCPRIARTFTTTSRHSKGSSISVRSKQ